MSHLVKLSLPNILVLDSIGSFDKAFCGAAF